MTKKIRRAQVGGQGTPSPARFAVGQRVCVKPGIKDLELGDLPLGGWVGTICEIDAQSNPPIYLIEWDRRTLDQMPPAYRMRAEQDDFDVECLWVEDAVLESAVIEQPTQLAPRPLQRDDPEDRVRAIFGLTATDPLPAADSEHLDRYREYLTAHLSFPFAAVYVLDADPPEGAEHPVTAVGLLGREDCDEENGLLCQADLQGRRIAVPLSDLEVDEDSPNHQSIEDYSYWFGNAPIGDFDETVPAQPSFIGGWGRLRIVAWFVLFGAVCGAVMGSLLAAVWGTQIAVLVGAVTIGLLGCLSGAKVAARLGAGNRLRHGSLIGGLAGALLGAVIGAPLGAMVMAALGTFPGAIVGGMLGKLLGRKPADTGKGVLLGMAVGAVALAFYRDQDAATLGTLHGAWIGAAAVVLLLLALIGVLTRAARRRQ